MSEKHKYHKYKSKYLALRRETGYNFKYFDNMDEQKDFINKNIEQLVYLMENCFPCNCDNVDIYRDRLLNIIKTFIDRQWYFVLSDDEIVGFCFLSSEQVFQINNKMPTYTPMELQIIKKLKLSERNLYTIDPVIYSLCKNKKFKNFGEFLFDNLFKHLQYDIIYLIPESVTFKRQMSDNSNCQYINLDKYQQSNTKLIEYYKSMGFQIMDNLYVIDVCEKDQVTLLNVLYKKL